MITDLAGAATAIGQHERQHGVCGAESAATRKAIESSHVAAEPVAVGPKRALAELTEKIKTSSDAEAFVKKARLDAILGAAPRSQPRIISGLRAWTAFALNILKQKGCDLPPSEDGLLAWSRIFRSRGTFANYLGAVKTACLISNVPTDVFESVALRRAKIAIGKLEVKKPLSPPIDRSTTRRLMEKAVEEDDPLSAALYCVAFAFLLRVPSEGLPLRVGAVGSLTPHSGKTLTIANSKAILVFDRRKNRESQTTAERSCWCKGCSATCPVHRLPALIPACREQFVAPFTNWRPHQVTRTLRRRLSVIGIPNAAAFTLKGFRRGHAQQIAEQGGALKLLLDAADWKSSAFATYLNLTKVEAAAVDHAAALSPAIVVGGSDDESDSDSASSGS